MAATSAKKPQPQTPRHDPEHDRDVLIDYLLVKVAEEDWHGVADAAMDLREQDAYARGKEDRE